MLNFFSRLSLVSECLWYANRNYLRKNQLSSIWGSKNTRWILCNYSEMSSWVFYDGHVGIREQFGNKTNLSYLIAATRLIIILKLDSNRPFFSRKTLKFDGWPRKTIGHPLYNTSSIVHHFQSIGTFNLELQSGNAQFGSTSAFFVRRDLEIWRMTFKNNRATLLCCVKPCVSLQSHRSI